MAMQPTRSKPAQPPQTRMSDEDFIKKVSSVGDMLRKNQVSANDGKETKDIKNVDKAYEAFMQSIKGQTEAMKNATEDQKDIYKELVEEMIKIRRDGKVDFDKTFKEMQAALATTHEKGGDAKSQEFLEQAIATAMQHTDKRKEKPSLLREEANHRIEKFFKPTGDDLESPLFRRMAGLDKKDHTKMISPLDEAKNLGTAERLKNQLGDDITGQAEKDKALEAMAKTMGSGHGSAFPSKIENLHVDKLIVKMVEREHSQEHAVGSAKQISHSNAGKSAVALPQISHNPTGPAGATVHPALPAPKDHQLVPVIHAPNQPSAPKKLESAEYDSSLYPKIVLRHPEGHEEVRQGSVKVKRKMHDVEDVDFTETPYGSSRPRLETRHAETVVPEVAHHEEPIKVKPGNPHVPLRTKETPMASAVRNAVGVGMAIPQMPTIVDSFKSKSDTLVDNDVGVRSADATKYTEKDVDPATADGVKPKGDGGIVSTLLDDAGDVLSNLGSKEPKVKAKGGVEPKTKIGKGLKTAGKIGKGLLKGAAAGVGGALVGAGLDYAGEELDKSGHDQMAIAARVGSKAASWAGTGAAIGSFVPGVGTAIGGAVGGLAGAADGLYEDWGNIDKPEWLGGKPKGKVDTKTANNSGEVLHSMNNTAADSKSAPVIIHAPQASAPNVASTTNFVPITATPRARESYFDRQMMNTFVK